MRISQPNSFLPSIQRGAPISVHLNDERVTAFNGETVAAVLLAEGKRVFRHTLNTGESRGVFCGMGICYDCLVTVDGEPNVRACITPVTDGMVIETHRSEIKL